MRQYHERTCRCGSVASALALWVARSFLRYITGPVARQLVRSLPCAGAQNMLKMQKKKKQERPKKKEKEKEFDELR